MCFACCFIHNIYTYMFFFSYFLFQLNNKKKLKSSANPILPSVFRIQFSAKISLPIYFVLCLFIHSIVFSCLWHFSFVNKKRFFFFRHSLASEILSCATDTKFMKLLNNTIEMFLNFNMLAMKNRKKTTDFDTKR